MNKDGNKPFIKSSHNILMGFSPVSGMHILKTKNNTQLVVIHC